MKAKRILSALLTVLMLVTVVASLSIPVTAAESDPITLTYTNPALTTDVGTEIDLSQISVQVDATTTLAAESITWKNGDSPITSFKPTSKGVTRLTATSGSTSKTVYVVAKNPDETEYVLYENDFETDNLVSDGWVAAPNQKGTTSTYSVSDGKLHLGQTDETIARIMLPEWLGDFGDYDITAVASQTPVANSSRWSSLIYHASENTPYLPYRHMCVRANTVTETVELAERTSAGWGYPYAASKGDLRVSYALDMTSAYHKLEIRVFKGTIEYLIDDNSLIFVDNLSALHDLGVANTTGMIGLSSDQGVMNVDSIKVTVRSAAPVKPAITTKLTDTSGNRPESNITSYVSNQAYAKDDAAFKTIIAAEKHPVAILIDAKADITAAEIESYLTTCIANNIIPEFRMTTQAQTDALVAAVNSTSAQEAVLVSSNADLIKSTRAQKPTVIRGVYEVTAEAMDKDTRFAEYQKAAGANAQGILLPYALATKDNVAVLQNFQLAVWTLGTDVDTDTEAAYLLASGANAVISDNWALVSGAETKLFTAENSLTRTPVVSGHRGYPEKYAENSIASYVAAYRAGADNLETDVHLSKDGYVMICHDDNIDRTTNGTGYIHDLTYEQLRSYKLNGTDEPIPTFEEMLIEFQDKDVKILCELKEDQAELPKKTAELVKKYGMEDQVLYISFFSNQVKLIKQELNTCANLLGGSFVAGADAAAVLNGYYTLQTSALSCNGTMGPSYTNVNAEYVRDAGDRGMTFWTWTYTSGVRSLVNEMFLAGMNGLTTNDAPYFTNVVKTIIAPDTVYAVANNKLTLNAKAITYGGRKTGIGSSIKVTALDNDGVVEINADGTVTAKKDGTATVLISYEATMPDGTTKYTLYTQPVTVKVGALDGLTLNSTDYTLDGDKVLGVAEKTSAEEFLLAVADAENAKLYDAEGKELTGTSVIGNGYTVEYKGKKATIVVLGDVSGNGAVDVFDYVLVKRSALNTFKPTDIQRLAADVITGSGDGIDSFDYLAVKRHVLGSFNIFN